MLYQYKNGVMVIVAGYGHGDTSSNPGPDFYFKLFSLVKQFSLV